MSEPVPDPVERLRDAAKSVLWVFDGNATTDERRRALESLRAALSAPIGSTEEREDAN